MTPPLVVLGGTTTIMCSESICYANSAYTHYNNANSSSWFSGNTKQNFRVFSFYPSGDTVIRNYRAWFSGDTSSTQFNFIVVSNIDGKTLVIRPPVSGETGNNIVAWIGVSGVTIYNTAFNYRKQLIYIP